MFPVITDENAESVMPVPVRIEKFAAPPRVEGVGPAPITPGTSTAAIRQINATVKTREKCFPPLFFKRVMFILLDVAP
jgi:hypothetical protein